MAGLLEEEDHLDYTEIQPTPEQIREARDRKQAIVEKKMPKDIPSPIRAPTGGEIIAHQLEIVRSSYKDYEFCTKMFKQNPAVLCRKNAEKFNQERSKLENLYVIYDKSV